MEANESLQLNIEKQSIRGRACPVCGGKIIPSDRAVYTSAGDDSSFFISWQCERCGHEEIYEKPKKDKPKHAPAKPAKPAATSTAAPAQGSASAPSPVAQKSARAAAHDLPPDVRKMLQVMNIEVKNGARNKES